MWIFTTLGFYSVVADAEKPGHVLVRARAKRDAWNLYRAYQKRFKMSRPKADEKRDYRWRLTMKRSDFAKIAASEVRQILYFNFKDAVHGRKDQANKTEPYTQVWAALLRAQRAEDPPLPPEARRFALRARWPGALDPADLKWGIG